MARPEGEIRQALADALTRLVQERGLVVDGLAVDGVTYVDAAYEAKVGLQAARDTLKNMRRTGQVAAIGRRKAARSPHWLAVYAPGHLVAAEALAD